MPSAIIVDDSPIMRTQLRKLLELAGFTVAAQAGSADQLMELYEQHRPDLVTLDIVMPGRDGASAAVELHARYPQAIIVICTSINTRDKIDACRRAGVRCYLIKPFNPDYAVSVFKRVLNYTREIPLPKLDDVAMPASATSDTETRR